MRLIYTLLIISGVQLFIILVVLGGWLGLGFALCEAGLAVLFTRVIGQAEKQQTLRRLADRCLPPNHVDNLQSAAVVSDRRSAWRSAARD